MENIKYPHLNRIAMLYPGPGIILGEELLWQPKWDGSNVRFYLDNENNVCMGSRNMPIASEDMLATAHSIPHLIDNVTDLLQDAKNWNDSYALFGELMKVGRSPTRLTTYNEPSFVAFDLYSAKLSKFVNYTALHQQCCHSNIPCIDVKVITRHTDIDELYAYRDKMLRENQDIEGFVIKTYDSKYSIGMLAVKEKHDTVKLDKIPRDIKDGLPKLPPLPDSEIYGAIDKVIADIGIEQFKDIKIAMPLVAQYVNTEAKKHFNSPPRSVFTYYQKVLEEL